MSTSKNLKLTICVGALLAPFLLGSAGADNNNKNKNNHNNDNTYSATFSGFEEIGPLGANETGAILSPAKGNLTLDVAKDKQSINFQLTYSGFTNNVTVSHIHFGKEHVAGGVMVFFCVNPPVSPPAAPATKPQLCPLTSGTVSGTLTPSDVVGPTGQAVKAGDFSALLAALQSNTAYGNIHTTAFPSGEIRGQIRPSENDD
jgi:CHRD domain